MTAAHFKRGAPITERIKAHVLVDENGCWIWQCRLGRGGYGQITVNGKRGSRAHRVSYEAFVGPIPDGLTVDHMCFVPACVNPDHLRLLPNRENARTRRADQTHCKRGHEFTPENTYEWGGSRICRACAKDRHKVAWQRKRETAANATTKESHA